MQINLFDSNKDYESIARMTFSKANSRRVNIVKNLYDYLNSLLQNNYTNYEAIYISKLITELETGVRSSKKVFYNQSDSHMIIEQLCAERYSKKYSLTVSLKYSLDLICNIICGADPKNIRSSPNYKDISEKLTSGNIEYIGTFDEFLNLDVNLDLYFINKYKELGSTSEVMCEFLKDVNNTLFNCKKYMAFEILHDIEGLSYKGQTLNEIIYSSENSKLPDIEVYYNDNVYKINTVVREGVNIVSR